MNTYTLEITTITLKPLTANRTISQHSTYEEAVAEIDRQCALFTMYDRNQPDFFKKVKAQMKRFKRTGQYPKIYVHNLNGELTRVLFKLTQKQTLISFDKEFNEEN